ncbi:unnamed protein product [Prunus brigantina]
MSPAGKNLIKMNYQISRPVFLAYIFELTARVKPLTQVIVCEPAAKPKRERGPALRKMGF